MTISRVELQGQITRAQDFTTIKHNDDIQPQVQQSSLMQNRQQAAELKLHHVNEKEEAENRQNKFDAKEKGSNQYQGNGGRSRKENGKNDGKVVLKGQQHGFDFKI